MREIKERDKDYLLSILDHCDRISEAVDRFGNTLDAFLNDPDYRDVIKMNLFQIGELSNQLSSECKELFPDIPWHAIYGTRNIIAHAYIKVDDEIIWETVGKDIPKLAMAIEDA